jgi:hypothetical protein
VALANVEFPIRRQLDLAAQQVPGGGRRSPSGHAARAMLGEVLAFAEACGARPDGAIMNWCLTWACP